MSEGGVIVRAVSPSVKVEDDLDGEAMIRRLEAAGRTCYRSEDRIDADSAAMFIKRILDSGHESVIEHEKITVRIVCDRGVSHEIVRHRIGSYSQESTRYCNYSAQKFGEEITCITPSFWEDSPEMLDRWRAAMENAERSYFDLLSAGAKPEQARSVLPNSLKTEIVVTYNLREWRHFLKLRTSKRAHPQIRELADEILRQFRLNVPVVFDDIATNDV